MELSDYRSFWIPEIMAKAFTLHDQDVQGPVDIKMRNLMNLSSVIKCTNIRSYNPKPTLNIEK
jgi:acetolactate synthase-1/2/3 large subunit